VERRRKIELVDIAGLGLGLGLGGGGFIDQLAGELHGGNFLRRQHLNSHVNHCWRRLKNWCSVAASSWGSDAMMVKGERVDSRGWRVRGLAFRDPKMVSDDSRTSGWSCTPAVKSVEQDSNH